MALDETIEENDKKVELDGLTFIYDKDLHEFMDQVTIDYIKSWVGEGFQIQYAGGSSC